MLFRSQYSDDQSISDSPVALNRTAVRPGCGQGLFDRLKRYLVRKKLVLNETKTRLVKFGRESFCFLGFEFSWMKGIRTKRWYVHVEPARKAQQRLRVAVRKKINYQTTHLSCTQTVESVNRIVRGWGNYYHYGHCSQVFRYQNFWVGDRLRRWLWRKYKYRHQLYSFFTNDRLQGQYKLHPLPTHAPWMPKAV